MFACGAKLSVAVSVLLAATTIWAAVPAARPVAPTGSAAATPQPDSWITYPTPGKFITRLLVAGNYLWVGTEDSGLWRLDLSKDPGDQGAWRQFTGKQIGGDVYGLAADESGRLWVGTASQGVSVYNGEKWKTYGIIEGCEGDHVFDIAADRDPKRPNVWIAHDHGVTMYGNLADGSTGWKSYTQADGLPMGAIHAVVVRADGGVVVAGECGDLAISIPPYDKWQSQGNIGLVNRMVLVNDNLAASTTQGLRLGKPGALKIWSGLSRRGFENYVTGIACDGSGLWLATRHFGPVYLDSQSGKAEPFDGKLRDYCMDVAVAGSDVWCSLYNGGLVRLKGAAHQKLAIAAKPAPASSPNLPEPAKPPTGKELEATLAKLGKSVGTGKRAALVGDDWKTQGDWVERIGWDGAALCAMSGFGGDFRTSHGGAIWYYSPWIGNSGVDDGIRYWVHYITTDNPKCLQNLVQGGRRQADWDDHGEVYPWDMNGPSVYCTLTVPKGDFIMSLYFFNKDGHWDNNRCRDFVVTVKETPGISVEKIDKRSIAFENYFNTQPTLAYARVNNFWDPVYKKFFLKGPGTYTVKIDRNGSFNTIVSGVFLDPVSMPYQGKFLAKAPEKAPAEPAAALHQKLLQLQVSDGGWSATSSRTYWISLARFLSGQDKSSRTVAENVQLADCFDALFDFSRRDELFDRKSYQYKRWLAFGEGGPVLLNQPKKGGAP
jgi:hypothetical protein